MLPRFDPSTGEIAVQIALLQAQAARARERNRTAYRLSPCGLNLPSGFNVDRDTAAYVAGVLKRILREPA